MANTLYNLDFFFLLSMLGELMEISVVPQWLPARTPVHDMRPLVESPCLY